MLSQSEQQKVAKKFAEEWKGKGYEKGESQKFWLDLLCNVFGIKNFSDFISFEDQVKLDHTSFIDGYIPSTKVLIEQKSLDKDLRAPIKQSDGSLLNPFQQAKRYITELPVSKHPRWVVTSNFRSFLVYDMENPNGEPEEILLENFEKEYYRLSFITESTSVHLKKELEISKKAGDIIGEIYDAILLQYKDGKNPSSATLKSLNMLCVRIVFCLYAEDAGIFGHKSIFGDYLKSFSAKDLRRALLDLFTVLDQKIGERDEYLEESLAQFPYVNGGLFTEEDKTIPPLTEEIKELLVKHASGEFDWSEISPTIFGAIFESTLNPETRRSGGMHYTSIENIHKVIDPLFLDDLKKEFEEIKEVKQKNLREQKAIEFQKKLGSLKFLDPACGSGNFLTETYLSLRKLENECLKIRFHDQAVLDVFSDTVFVKIHQFYGIEINDFASVVAKTALWIAESQMMSETAKILQKNLEFLPLKSYANITEGNALRVDWESVVSKNELNYILGNPPFVGAKLTTEAQRLDKINVFKSEDYGKLDYVSCWYKKCADFIQNTNIKCALVSTNSVTQGEQVPLLWKLLFSMNITIDFAYRTFIWDSEANLKAHVHCVIVGFSFNNGSNKTKKLYINESQMIFARNINGYLVDANNIFIEKRQKNLCEKPSMTKGSQLIDNGNFVFDEQSKDEFVKKYPDSITYFYRYINADSFLNNRETKFCLCLKDCPPNVIKKNKGIYDIVNKVYEYRLNSEAESTKKLSSKPSQFFITNIPIGNSLLVPVVSSERRRYIPIGFISDKCIYTNATNYIDHASLYDFGVLISNVHMAWMRAVCGRLKSDYRYSKDIVYNNFPWPEIACHSERLLSLSKYNSESINKEMLNQVQHDKKSKIETTAQGILDARAKYPSSSLADLYDENLMPAELRKAHQENDRAVMSAYGFSTKMTESECVAELFKMYEKLLK